MRGLNLDFRTKLRLGLFATSNLLLACSSQVDLSVNIRFAEADVSVVRNGQRLVSPYRLEDSFGDIAELAKWRLILDVEHGDDLGKVEIRSFCALSDQPELESEQMDVFVYWGPSGATFKNGGICEDDGQTGVWTSRVAQPLGLGPIASTGAEQWSR